MLVSDNIATRVEVRYGASLRAHAARSLDSTADRDYDSRRALANVALQELSGFTALQRFLGLGEVLGEQNGHG